MYCTNCGAGNDTGVQFCTNCGAPLSALGGSSATPPQPQTPAQPQPQAPPPQQQPQAYQQPYPPQQQYPPQYGGVPMVDPTAKSKLVAGLLGIFVGWLGIHRFYLGYNNIGMAQLATGVIGLVLSPFTCGLILLGASIWGLVDGIMILTGSIRTDATGKPLRD